MQQKISAAESEAERMLLPGAHSTEPGEAGEILPVWVELFRKYFEKKKSALSKTAQQEQFRTTLRTMRNTLVPPSNSLDHRDGNSELVTETTAPVTNHATANSLVATGGTLSLVPTSGVTTPGGHVRSVPNVASMTANARNVRQRIRSVSHDVGGIGIMGSSVSSLPAIMDMMHKQNQALLRRSFREVHSDYQLAKAALAKATSENDQGSITFYRIACRNIEEEMRAFENA